jgi:hypothetical protein
MTIQTKEQYLEQIFDQVARTVDRQGRPIDLGIMGVVLYLNVHGIRTIFSCEGHLDHGEPYPWVWVDKASSNALRRMVKSFGGHLIVNQMFSNTYQLTCYVGTLPEKQAEMQRFAEFLRDKFFEGEGDNSDVETKVHRAS